MTDQGWRLRLGGGTVVGAAAKSKEASSSGAEARRERASLGLRERDKQSLVWAFDGEAGTKSPLGQLTSIGYGAPPAGRGAIAESRARVTYDACCGFVRARECLTAWSAEAPRAREEKLVAGVPGIAAGNAVGTEPGRLAERIRVFRRSPFQNMDAITRFPPENRA